MRLQRCSLDMRDLSVTGLQRVLSNGQPMGTAHSHRVLDPSFLTSHAG